MSLTYTSRRDELVRSRHPFVEATVVRVEQPTSARAGDRALVLPDGSLEGFVGGQCTVSSVKVAALGALQTHESVLLRVLPDGDARYPETSGSSVVVNPCLSGGAVEIFLEPVLPLPVLYVLGESPIARALADAGPVAGFEVLGADDEVDLSAASAVVIARHGGPEASEVRAALDAGVAYIGLVASRKRGAAVLEEADVTAAELPRVFTPAGLDIGARGPGEIALSILAQVVSVRRADDGAVPEGAADHVPADVSAEHHEHHHEPLLTIGGGPGEAPQIAIDPVCGMQVVVEPGAIHLEIDGDDYYFCRTGCRDAYAEERGVSA